MATATMEAPQLAVNKRAPTAEDTQIHQTHHGGFRAMSGEYNYWCDTIEGKIPKDLSGTFFRNGPGRMSVGNDQFGHWFDGDGMVSAITFHDGKVHYKNRFVRTPKYVKETQVGHIAFRGFGTMRHGGALKNMLRPPANPANTNVVYHGNKLLALYEGGHPFELDPNTLNTVGEYFYDGQLGVQNTFSAHGKVHPKTGNFFNFGIGFTGFSRQGLKSKVDFYKVSPNGRLVKKVALPVKGSLPFLHDFAITENHAVIVVSSIVMEGMLKCALGIKTIADSTVFDDRQPAQVIVLDLNTLEEVERFELSPMGVIHFGNAWEEKGDIIFELIRFNDFGLFQALKNVISAPKVEGAEFIRCNINLKQATMKIDSLDMPNSEFPTWNNQYTGLKNRYTYSVSTLDNGTGTYFNSVLKRDQQTGDVKLKDFGPGKFTTEAIYIPSSERIGEDDGYVSSVIYDADKGLSEIAVLDAKDLSDIARVKLSHHIPHGFHGHYAPDVFL
ncbi:MAG: carotenoid oxygenase family protein [Pseudomonadales bacterium]|nr:carotenoid oxygenase family protein [Pseudomonadales bacterium]